MLLRRAVDSRNTLRFHATEEPMKSAEDIESYLIQMEAQYEAVGESLWVLKDMGADVVVSITDPVLVIRAKVLEIDKVDQSKRLALFEKLLELNATDMLHGAYGLEEGSIVVTNALPLENLDFNEFQASVDDISMALANHYKALSALAA